MTAQDDEEQDFIWQRLHKQVAKLLSRYGVNDATGKADYLIVDDNYGWHRVIVPVQRLHMFRAEIVAGLRALLQPLPAGWEITYVVDVPGKEKEWPKMGLTIRKHEIIDGLQRHLMPELVNTFYEGGRPGTGDD
ncbi:MAG TPA: hypothetical protein VHD59_01945 [Pseudolabrys sp.]|jgi:hypothetical protein|nr:hypothetical protein [Pseudolabrys sp.]